jgi:hypothetical protein
METLVNLLLLLYDPTRDSAELLSSSYIPHYSLRNNKKKLQQKIWGAATLSVKAVA